MSGIMDIRNYFRYTSTIFAHYVIEKNLLYLLNGKYNRKVIQTILVSNFKF